MTVNNYENEKRAPDIDFAGHIADYFVNMLCVQVRRLLYSYENLKGEIADPRVVYDAAFQSIKQITQEVDHCAETMERRLERLMEKKCKEPVNEE